MKERGPAVSCTGWRELLPSMSVWSGTTQIKDRLGIALPKIGGDARSRNPSNARADFLNRGHERIGEDHRPQQTIAELGPDLRIGCDSTGIVIGRTCDEAGAKLPEKTYGATDARRSRAGRYLFYFWLEGSGGDSHHNAPGRRSHGCTLRSGIGLPIRACMRRENP
jgi:hypothetical protein